MNPELPRDESRVFVLGFDKFSIYYLADSNQVVSRLQVEPSPEPSGKAAQEKNR